MSSADFSLADNWLGGSYELSLKLGPINDARLDCALQAVTEFEDIDGWYRSSFGEPATQTRITPTVADLDYRLEGIASIPGFAPVVCSLTNTREEHSGLDWVAFLVPLGALNRAGCNTGGYPFEPADGWSLHTGSPLDGWIGRTSSLRWRQPLDEWLAQLGRHVFERVDFELAMIGFDVFGADELDSETTSRHWSQLRRTRKGLIREPATD